jgi:putative methionine-R-sulfoxide reductase with GAF domain
MNSANFACTEFSEVRCSLLKYVALRARNEFTPAAGVARAIRRAGTYRWVGLYEVTEDEIVNLAFDGLGVPAHPRFPSPKA